MLAPRLSRSGWLLLSVLPWVLQFPQLACAQSGNTSLGGTQTYGSFGNRTLGSTGSTLSGTGSSAFGSSSGLGSTGSSFGSSGAMPQGATSVPNTSVGQVTGSERYLQQNRQGAFVGADSGDSRNAFSQQQATQQNQAFNNLFGQQGLFSQMNRLNQLNQRNSQNQGKNALRIPIRFESEVNTVVTSSQVSQQLETRLTHLPALEKMGRIQVTMQGRTAILQGRVPTEREKRLAAGVALLEPGISDVQNDLIVDPAATKAEVLPPPSAPN